MNSQAKLLIDTKEHTMILFGHLGLTYAIVRSVDKISLKGRKKIDYRLVLVGSMLPDLADKPVIFLLSSNSIHSGRIFAHTLLFTLLLSIAGILVLKKYSRSWLLVLACSSFIHLLLDSMWHYPDTLFWPAYGLSSIMEQEFSSVTVNSIYNVILNLSTGLPELIGFLIITFLGIRLLIKKQAVEFLRTGHIK